jgi:hypothetical protein
VWRVFEGSCRLRYDRVKVWVHPCCRPGGMTPHDVSNAPQVLHSQAKHTHTCVDTLKKSKLKACYTGGNQTSITLAVVLVTVYVAVVLVVVPV